jgi:hypothetical protein
MDSTGSPIEGAHIFCLYHFTYIPQEPVHLAKLIELLNQETVFDFELFQNFPNPISNSTFLRFSLPQECEIMLTIQEKHSSNIVYQHNDVLPYGLYQMYLENLVDSLNLMNGVYVYSLQAEGKDGTQYSSQRELMIIGNMGEPNAISTANGEYFFEYGQAFVGDSVVVNPTGDPYYMNNIVLNNTVNFVVEKEGYISKIFNVDLYPAILLRSDIVLLKENLP